MRSDERGAALAITMMLVSGLLAAGGLVVYLQMADTRATQYIAEKRSAFYCAEAGLAGGREYIANNAGAWSLMLDGEPENDPEGYPVEGDLDGDGTNDWHVEIRDNDDELPTDDPTTDADGTIFMVSTCLQYPDTPRQVTQLVRFTSGSYSYRNQRGQGAGNTNNAN